MAGKIILPSDSKDAADAKARRDPERVMFEEYKSLGYDSETAARLSGLVELDTLEQASAVLAAAASEQRMADYEVVESIAYEVPQAVRHIGSTAGAAVGSAIGIGIIQAAVKHSSSVIIVGVTAAGVIGATFATKFVASWIGKFAAIATAANILSATGFIAMAVFKQRRRR